jgi:NhaP-type Na+/H+ and K+/H+ antiporter
VRPVLGIGLTLSTLGVALTALLLGTFAWFMLGTFANFDLGTTGLSWVEGLVGYGAGRAMVLVSVPVQGLSLAGVAKRLGLVETGS